MRSTHLEKASAAHKQLRDELVDVIRKHLVAGMSRVEVLALTSFLVGQLIAIQDQRRITKDEALLLVSRNVEQGNMEAIETLMAATETSGTA